MSNDPAQDDPANYPRLSSAETEQFTTVLAELASAELPLSSGLRAAAQEASSRRLASALKGVAKELEQGRSLTDVLAGPRQPLPPHVVGLITAGIRSGRLGTALAEFFEQQRTADDLRRSARAALAYPAVLVGFMLVLYAFMSWFIVGPLKALFTDFEIKLQPWIVAMLWVATHGVWLLLAALAAAFVVLLVMRPVLGAARWQLVVSSAPFVGPIWHWTGAAEALRLLALLVEQQVPLPTALDLTAGGVGNADVAQACRLISAEIVSGRSFSEALGATSRLPPLVTPLVRWGEFVGALPSALITAGEAFESRARRRIELLRIVLPPIVFVLVGCSVAFVVIGLFSPLLSLIRGLSGQ